LPRAPNVIHKYDWANIDNAGEEAPAYICGLREMILKGRIFIRGESAV
jgi:hypothetical protein